MNREQLQAKYIEYSISAYKKLLSSILTNSPILFFQNGKAYVTDGGENKENGIPMNGMYVMMEKDKDGFIHRIVRVGTHEDTSINGLPQRVFTHMVGSKNRSILRKHIGSSMLKGKDEALNTWIVKKERGDLETEKKVTEYIEKNICVGFIPVENLDDLQLLERYLISVTALATMSDEHLINERARWLGNKCENETVALCGMWNDDHVKWHPKDELELEQLKKLVNKYSNLNKLYKYKDVKSTGKIAPEVVIMVQQYANEANRQFFCIKQFDNRYAVVDCVNTALLERIASENNCPVGSLMTHVVNAIHEGWIW